MSFFKMFWYGLKIGIGIGMVYISGHIDGRMCEKREAKKEENNHEED